MKITRKTFLKSAATTVSAAAALPSQMTRATALTQEQSSTAHLPVNEKALALWYRQPADEWLQALPIGNGRIAAMVFGSLPDERLALNHGAVWAGSPHNYTSSEALAALPEIRRLVFAGAWKEAQDLVNAHFVGRPAGQAAYQTVGNLHLGGLGPGREGVSEYRRELDLETAIARTVYVANGVRCQREIFASALDKVIVVRLTADQPGQIGFTLRWDSPHQTQSTVGANDTLILTGSGGPAFGQPGAVRFEARVRVQPEGGRLNAQTDHLTVDGADSVTLLIAIASSYVDYRNIDGDPEREATRILAAASRKSYADLRRNHLADYRPLFERVRLDLGTTPAAQLPTDERVRAFRMGHDPALSTLHFQFGRYLLIACSRPGGQAATLQGLWNNSTNPPWGSKYTVNINTEMNYWPAGPANLLECYTPLFDLISDLAVTGARTARVQYGAGGWVCHHNTDGWRGAAPVDGAFWGMWPTGGAWLCKSFWDHYEFTGDKNVLRKHYPLMKGAAQFFLETLVEEPTHRYLVTCPSVSPEHGHHPGVSICAGPTMDSQILRDLFDAVTAASEILAVDDDLRQRIRAHRDRLPPMRIGKAGQLQEWMEDWDMEAEDIHHRHVSHLYGLYPSHQITPQTPDLFAAARKTLEIRGDEATGWSLAWKINFWARLRDGDRAHKLLTDLLTPERTAPNLFDLHPPFQIDGNFGAAAGVAEMLLQSHNDELHLLPALPTIWPSGIITGLLARGGFVVDLVWAGGALRQVTILSRNGGPCRVRVGETTTTLTTQRGRSYLLGSDLKVAAKPPSAGEKD